MRTLSLLVCILCWCTVATAGAQTERDEEARILFEAAEVAYSNGHYADALERFESSYALSQRPELLFNIGAAADRLRRDEKAIEAFERYLEVQPDAANRSDVEARLAILREAVARAEDGIDGGVEDEAHADGGRPLTWTFAAATVAFGALAGVAWAVGGNQVDKLEARCADGGCTEAEIEDSPVRSWDRLTTASLVLAGVSLAATVAFVFVEAPDRDAEGVRVGVGPGSLAVSGTF